MKNKLYYQFSGSCFLLLFIFLGYVIKFYEHWIEPFDTAVTKLVRLSYPAMNTIFLWITKFANPVTIVILAAAILFLLVRGKKYVEGIWLTCNMVVIGGILNPLLKIFFSRERPSLVHLVTETSKSFPSGHAVASMILYGTVIFILPKLMEEKSLRLMLQIVLGLLILFIDVSRIYLGVHFPSDIVGGSALALAWLLFTYPILDKYRFVWKFKGKQN